MAFGMYAASVPVYQRQLGALSKILEKGSAWAAARKVDEAVLMGTRMIPDMLPLQPPGADRLPIRRGEHRPAGRRRGAQGAGKRREDPGRAAGPHRRRARRLKAFKPEQIDGSEGREIVLTIGGNPMKLTGRAVPARHCHAELLFPLHDDLRNLASGRRRDRETGFPRRALRSLWTERRSPTALGLSAAMCITARQPGGPPKGRRFCFLRAEVGDAVSGSAHIR